MLGSKGIVVKLYSRHLFSYGALISYAVQLSKLKSMISKTCKISGADPHRFPPFYENRSEFSQINKFKKKLSKVKSGQYPDWMTQVTLGGKKKKILRGACLGPPLGAYTFDARFGKRSVFILDPRLDLLVLFKSLENSQCSISGLKKYFPQKEIFYWQIFVENE